MQLQQDQGTGFTVWLSEVDTFDWPRRAGKAWPCSTLDGKRVRAEFNRNGLVGLKIDGKDAPDDIDAHELNSMLADHLDGKLAQDNVAWFVAVGQFTGRVPVGEGS